MKLHALPRAQVGKFNYSARACKRRHPTTTTPKPDAEMLRCEATIACALVQRPKNGRPSKSRQQQRVRMCLHFSWNMRTVRVYVGAEGKCSLTHTHTHSPNHAPDQRLCKRACVCVCASSGRRAATSAELRLVWHAFLGAHVCTPAHAHEDNNAVLGDARPPEEGKLFGCRTERRVEAVGIWWNVAATANRANRSRNAHASKCDVSSHRHKRTLRTIVPLPTDQREPSGGGTAGAVRRGAAAESEIQFTINRFAPRKYSKYCRVCGGGGGGGRGGGRRTTTNGLRRAGQSVR